MTGYDSSIEWVHLSETEWRFIVRTPLGKWFHDTHYPVRMIDTLVKWLLKRLPRVAVAKGGYIPECDKFRWVYVRVRFACKPPYGYVLQKVVFRLGASGKVVVIIDYDNNVIEERGASLACVVRLLNEYLSNRGSIYLEGREP